MVMTVSARALRALCTRGEARAGVQMRALTSL